VDFLEDGVVEGMPPETRIDDQQAKKGVCNHLSKGNEDGAADDA
jgi:hypothetical protein